METPTQTCGSETTVETSIFSLDVVTRAAYLFTDRYYVLVEKSGDAAVRVSFRPKLGTAPLDILGAFSNELLDQRLRATIAEETRTIRDLIVAQAFVEADLFKPPEEKAPEGAE